MLDDTDARPSAQHGEVPRRKRPAMRRRRVFMAVSMIGSETDIFKSATDISHPKTGLIRGRFWRGLGGVNQPDSVGQQGGDVLDAGRTPVAVEVQIKPGFA